MSTLPKLFLHDRTSVTAAVNEAEAVALAACFGANAAPSELERQTATRLLMHLRDQESWLACGCREPGVQPPPLMSPRLRQSSIHLWRHGSTPHDSNCAFFVPRT